MKASPEQAERLHRFAHDLRNRLAAIQQVLGQLDGSPVADRAELIAFAEQQYFKAMRASEDLLDDFKVERSPSIAAPAPVDLGECLERAIDSLGRRFNRKQQTVERRIATGLMAKGDARLLEELFAALLSNASKFSPAGASIAVEAKHDGKHAVITIRDRGIGLDAEDLAQVFSRYAMLKGRSTAGEAQGRSTLSRARQWAEAHGGTLTGHSDGAGAGSAFTVRLPMA